MVLNVGDKVFVKKNLVVNKSYGKSKTSFHSDMKTHRGRLVTISAAYRHGDCSCYKIAEDGSYWFWVLEMFEINQEQEVEIWF